MIYKIMIFCICLFIKTISAEQPAEAPKSEKGDKPPKIGNFVLPNSQQPHALRSIGGNILDKNAAQLFLFSDYFSGPGTHTADIVPFGVYGITDDLSLLLSVPIAASYKQAGQHSSGLEDATLQAEYAFYTQDTKTYEDQATVVASILFPTGSDKKQPPTGFGSPSFFLGGTCSRLYTDWFFIASPGATLTTSHASTKFGNEYLYQAGVGKNILTIGFDWMFDWLFEVNGQYNQKNRISGQTDPNSGGNVIFVTPSLFLSSKTLIFQLGVGFPVVQHLYGNQQKNRFLIVGNFTWTF